MSSAEGIHLVDGAVMRTWEKRLPFVSIHKGKEHEAGIFQQKAPLILWPVMAVLLWPMYLSVRYAFADAFTFMTPTLFAIALALLLLPAWGLFLLLSFTVGASVTEYRDRVEVRRFFRTQTLHYADIVDVGFIEHRRGPFSFSLVVSDEAGPDSWVSAHERAKAGMFSTSVGGQGVRIALRKGLCRCPVTSMYALFLVARTKKPMVFRQYLLYTEYRGLLYSTEVKDYAIELNARAWNVPAEQIRRAFVTPPRGTPLAKYPDLATEIGMDIGPSLTKAEPDNA